ncbi:MAG: NapC/NirT family cytochrome c [Coriobacteriia bacterium]|nr:NapC/NirT family cytochrome c [Coriobacteriia bacterium]
MQDFIDTLWQIVNVPVHEDSFAQRLDYLAGVIRNPQSDVPVAILLFAIASLIILVIFSIVLLIVLRLAHSEPTYALVDAEGNPIREISAEEAEKRLKGSPLEKVQRTTREILDKTAAKIAINIIIWVGIALIVAAITGTATRSNTFCNSCHEENNHSQMLAGTAHANVLCVDCHETGGMVQSFTVNVPGRLVHTAAGFFWQSGVNYAFFPRESCFRCHPRESLAETIIVDNIAMQHEPPLEAGLTCIQCHTFSPSQEFSFSTRGMQTCLRCHDGENVNLDCEICHRPSLSVVPRTELDPDTTAQALLQGVDFQQGCYRCHDPRPCDACHGYRIPHAEGYTFQPHVDDARRYGYRTCLICHWKGSPTGIPTCDDPGCHGNIWQLMEVPNPSGQVPSPSWRRLR